MPLDAFFEMKMYHNGIIKIIGIQWMVTELYDKLTGTS